MASSLLPHLHHGFGVRIYTRADGRGTIEKIKNFKSLEAARKFAEESAATAAMVRLVKYPNPMRCSTFEILATYD